MQGALVWSLYIATPLFLSQYVCGTQLKHSRINIWLSVCVYMFTYLLSTLLRYSVTIPRPRICFHRWVSDKWIGSACCYGSGTGVYISVAPLQFSFYCWACLNIMLSWISCHVSISGSEADDDAWCCWVPPWRSYLTFGFNLSLHNHSVWACFGDMTQGLGWYLKKHALRYQAVGATLQVFLFQS